MSRITCDKQYLYFYKDIDEKFPYEDKNLLEPFLVVQVKPSVSINFVL